MKKYEMEGRVKRYLKRTAVLKDNMTDIFTVTRGQCSKEMTARIEAELEFGKKKK